MPFDSTPQETKTLTLADLAWRLRHPETWPSGFVWEYSDCRTCAMGLAYRLLEGKAPTTNLFRSKGFWGERAETYMAERIPEISDPHDPESMELEAGLIFFNLDEQVGLKQTAITAPMVADALDAWLATRRVPAPAA